MKHKQEYVEFSGYGYTYGCKCGRKFIDINSIDRHVNHKLNERTITLNRISMGLGFLAMVLAVVSVVMK